MKLSRYLKSSLCLLMAVLMIIPLTSCGEKAVSADTIKNLYKYGEFNISTDITNIDRVLCKGDTLYVFGGKDIPLPDGTSDEEKEMYGGTAGQEYYLNICSIDGTVQNSIKLYEQNYTSKAGSYLNSVDFDTEGNLVLLMTESSYTMEDYSDYKEQSFIKKFDKDGKEISSTKFENENGNMYYIKFAKDGNVYGSDGQAVYVFDKDMKLLFQITNGENSYIDNIVTDKTGKVYVLMNDFTNNKYSTVLKTIDVGTKAFGESIDFNIMSSNGIFSGNEENDFYFTLNGRLYSYDIATQTKTEVINWTASGINDETLSNYCFLDNGDILAYSYDYSMQGEGKSKIVRMTKLDPADVKEKSVISLYCCYLDYNLKNSIIEFNKTSEDSVIVVTDYSEYNDYTSEEGYLNGFTKLNNDITAGNVPDLLLIDMGMPVSSYASKGMLTDLSEKFANDSEINMDDFVPNAIEALKTDGKLYSISKTFSINALIGKTELIGSEYGWTFDEMNAALAKLPEGATMFSFDMTKENFLTQAIILTSDEYIDWEKGECTFNSDSFIKLLEYANQFQDKVDYESSKYDDSYWQDQQTAFLDNKALLSSGYIYGYDQVRQSEAEFGGPVSFVGFPCEGKKKPVFSFSFQLAIMSKGKNTDGAYNFLKYYLNHEEDDEGMYDRYNFSIKTSENQKLAEKALNPDKGNEGDGKNIVYSASSSYYVGNQEIKLRDVTQADIDCINNLIASADSSMSYSEEVLKIVNEESGAYFAGQKTSKEVAELIQNRVSIYLSESR